jgi:glutathionylspermidine synthase
MTDYAAFARRLTASGVISDPWFEGEPRFRPLPVVLRPPEQAALYQAAEEMAAVWNELCLLCARDPALVSSFLGLTPIQQALWSASAPLWHGIARADVFFTDAGPMICELNCDTPTGEAESVLLNEAVAELHPRLSDPNRVLAHRFCAMIAAMAGTAEPLSIGLVYPTEIPEDLSMVLLYRRWFEERGWNVTLGSPFNLRRFDGGRAGLFETVCDVFVRHYKTDWWSERAPAWADEPEAPDPEPLGDQLAIILGAALAGTCTVVNPFGAVVPQNKRSMALMWERIDLFSPQSRDAIRRYLPETFRLEVLPRSQLVAEQSEWVLKSDYGCEGDEVVIGWELSADLWKESLELAVPGRWVAQRRFRPRTLEDGVTVVNHGVFLVGGRASGLYARLSRQGTDRAALSAPVFIEP